MTAFIVRRVLAGAVLMLVISFLTFVLLSWANTDVARIMLGTDATPEQVAAMNANLGLDRPVVVQYADWLDSALRGDLGQSWFTSEDVDVSLAQRLPVTLSLMLGVTAVTVVVAIGLGVWAGVRRGAVDRVVQVLAVTGYALPGFLVTLVIVLVFAVRLEWFPAVGYTALSHSFTGWLSTVTLPIAALSVGAIAGVSQQVRSSVIEVLAQDYVRTLRARGLPMRRVLFRHVLRNAAAPALTVLGLQFVALLGGTVLVEQIFGLPGIGSMTVEYTTRGDVPVIMGLLVVTVVGVVVVNLFIDVAIGLLNPKARVS